MSDSKSRKQKPSRKQTRTEKELGSSQNTPTMVGTKIELTPEQKQVNNLIKGHSLVFVQGSAGSGKTLGVLSEFVDQYNADRTKKIIVIRTPVEAGSDKIGFLPDDYAAKVEPHFQSARDALNLLLGKGRVDCDMNHRIFFKIPNYALGSTWDNALVLIDEAQQLQPMIMKLLLERSGINTRVVVVSDPTQLYVNDHTRNGADHAFKKFIDNQGVPYYPIVDWYQYPIESSRTRSDLAFTVVHAYSTR